MREVPEGGWKSLNRRGFFLTVGSKVIIKVLIAHSHQGPSCKAVPKWGIWDGQCLKSNAVQIQLIFDCFFLNTTSVETFQTQ